MLALDHSYSFNQGEVRYGVIGDGPPLVLIHGTPWSSFTWHHLAPELAKTHRVYYYDLIGYGQSEKRDGQQVSLDVQSRLLTELLAHWRIDNPVIIAHDFGGAISLRSHLLDQQNYSKLVLMNVVAMAPWGSPFFAHVQKYEAAFAGVPAYIHKAVVEAYIRGAMFGELNKENFATLVKPWISGTGQCAFYRQIAQADQKYTDEVEPLYGDIRCPVQILWGENDDWIPIETGRRLQAAIPHSEFYPISKAGHLTQSDNPKAIAEHIKRFLS